MAAAIAMAVHHPVIYRTNRIQSFISDLYIGSIYHFYSVCVYWKCHAVGMTVFSLLSQSISVTRFSVWNFVKFSGLECFRRNKADEITKKPTSNEWFRTQMSAQKPPHISSERMFFSLSIEEENDEKRDLFESKIERSAFWRNLIRLTEKSKQTAVERIEKHESIYQLWKHPVTQSKS